MHHIAHTHHGKARHHHYEYQDEDEKSIRVNLRGEIIAREKNEGKHTRSSISQHIDSVSTVWGNTNNNSPGRARSSITHGYRRRSSSGKALKEHGGSKFVPDLEEEIQNLELLDAAGYVIPPENGGLSIVDKAKIKAFVLGSAHEQKIAKKSDSRGRAVIFDTRRMKRKLLLADEERIYLEEKRKKAQEIGKNNAFNFAVGDDRSLKLVRYEDYSLGLFGKGNRMRQFCVKLALNKFFQRFILFAIVLNAIIFAISDYSEVDEDGNLVANGSWRNSLNIYTNTMFVAIFTVELVIKVIAQGFYGRQGAYLKSKFNILDMLVVASGLAVLFDNSLANISGLRLIRIVRPLRSLSMLPSLRNIVTSIFAAMPELGGVFSILGFIFLVFAIAGMELFGGNSNHARCRATPYPVNMSYTTDITDYAAYRCTIESTLSLTSDDLGLDKSSSPWATKQDCWWPLADDEDVRLCSLDGSGLNPCIHDSSFIDYRNWTWCGSNFDAYGNARFQNMTYGNGHYPLNDDSIYHPELNFGYSQFDNFGSACLTIFQTITEEGWTNIMYMQTDAYGSTVAAPFFVLLILLGVFFVLQLLLAVLEDNFSTANEAVKEQLELERIEKATKLERLNLEEERQYRHRRYKVLLIEDSIVQQKMMKWKLYEMDYGLGKDMIIESYCSCTETLKRYTYSDIIHLFDCVIVENTYIADINTGANFVKELSECFANLKQLKEEKEAAPDPIIDTDISDRFFSNKVKPKPAGNVMKTPKRPIYLSKIIGWTADYDRQALTLLDAGADVVLNKLNRHDINEGLSEVLLDENLGVGFMKWSEADNEDDEDEHDDEHVDNILIDVRFLGTADKHEVSRRWLKDKNLKCMYEAVDRGIEIVCPEAGCTKPLIRANYDVNDDCDNSTVDGSRDGGSASSSKQEELLMNESFSDIIPCMVCHTPLIGAHFCCEDEDEECDVFVCGICATLDWEDPYVSVGEEVSTAYGPCRVIAIREKDNASLVNHIESLDEDLRLKIKHKHNLHNVSQRIDMLVCEPTQWTLATGKSPTLYLRPEDVDANYFSQGDIVGTTFGKGEVMSIRKSVASTVYKVLCLDWILADDQPCYLYLNRASMTMILPANQAIIDEDVGQDHFIIRTLNSTVEMASKVTGGILASVRALCNPEEKTATTKDSKLRDKEDASEYGFQRFLAKRFQELSHSIRKNQNIDKVDDEQKNDTMNVEGSHDVHDLVAQEIGSYVRLESLKLSEIIGKTLAGLIWTISTWILNAYTDSREYLRQRFKKKKVIVEIEEIPYEDLPWTGKVKRDIRDNCRALALYEKYEIISGSLIFINCIVLMADHHPQSTTATDTLDIMNAILTILFALEMMMMLCAFGPKYYTSDKLNAFDAFVVVASLIDLALAPPRLWGSTGIDLGSVGSVGAVISLLRCFRLFRMIKLVLKVKSLKILFARIVKTFYDLSAFILLLGLILFIYTVAGLQFFANRFRFGADYEAIEAIGSTEWENAPHISRYNFDDFSLSFASVFQILTTENWNDIMFDIWRVYGGFGTLYPLSLVLCGTFVLMNLFLGILLGNFTTEEGFDDESTVADGRLASPMSSPPETPSHDFYTHEELAIEDHDESGLMQTDADRLNQDSDYFIGDGEKEAADDHIRYSAIYQGAQSQKPFSGVNPMSPLSDEKSVLSPQRRMVHLSVNDDVNETSDRIDNSTSAFTPIATGDKESDKALEVLEMGHMKTVEFYEGEGKEASSTRSDGDQPTTTTDTLYERFCCCCGGNKAKEDAQNEEDEGELVEIIKTVNRKNGSFAKKNFDLLSMAVDVPDDDQVFPLPDVYSLGLFHRTNPVRVACGHLLTHPFFEPIVQMFIFISSVALIFDSPLNDPDSEKVFILEVIGYVCTAIFTIEMTIKIIALGLYWNKRAYLRSYWNILDFIIVSSAWVGLFLAAEASGFKALRILRAFRPLRVINRAPGLRLIVNATLGSIPDVMNVVAVLTVIFSLFAIVSVNFLKGDLRHCTGDNYDNNIAANSTALNLLTYPVSWNSMSIVQKATLGPSSTIHDMSTAFSSNCNNWPTEPCCPYIPTDYDTTPTSRDLCRCWAGSWEPVAYIVFDNYPVALMGYFLISTTEGWVDLMYAAVDSTGIDMQPIRNTNYGYIYFFVFFIVIGSFFALNLFVGVMIDNFEKAKDKNIGQVSYMTPEQQEWVRTYQIVKSLKPHRLKTPPKDKAGKYCFAIVQHKYFEITILVFIVMNTIVLAGGYFGMSDTYSYARDILNTIFAIIFSIEMVLKLTALRWIYFSSKWNIFDAIVTIGSDIGVLLFWTLGDHGTLVIMILRVFRVLRVVRLMEGMAYARRLIDTLVYTLPGIINISILLLLIIFIYAILGMQLFAKVGYNKSYNEYANFRTFESALLTLFRFTTGEGWGNYMFDTAEEVDQCDADPAYSNSMCGFNDRDNCEELNGCGQIGIFPFLLSFTIIVSMVLFNLFVGIIIEGFQSSNDDDICLRSNDFKIFCRHWAHWDDNCNLFITVEDLEEFVATLPEPMGLIAVHPTHSDTIKFIKKLRLKVYCLSGMANYVHFKDVLIALITEAIGNAKGGELDHLKSSVKFADDVVYKQTLGSGAVAVKKFSKGEDENSDHFTLQEHYAAVMVQAAVRRWRYRNKVQKRKKIVTQWLDYAHRHYDSKGSDTSTSPFSSPNVSPKRRAKGFFNGDNESSTLDWITASPDSRKIAEQEKESAETGSHSSNFFSLVASMITPKPAVMRGRKLFKNGDVYEGDLVDGKMNGEGRYMYHDGAVYEGHLRDGKRHGAGVYTRPNGDKFVGHFINNKRHSVGIRIVEGHEIQGEWNHGVRVL